jgi:multimeric flavodoxin WrbA
MKITILNGSPKQSLFDRYLEDLKLRLETKGNQVIQLDLRSLPLRHCVGCWGCWVKTPGQCVSRDASIEMDRAVINADFVLWAAPLMMGFPTELLKMALDKHLPLIHPYMEVAYGEGHHLKRYKRYPRAGLLLEKETTSDDGDLQIVQDIFCRTAINFKTRLEFSLTTEFPVEEVAKRMTASKADVLPLPARLPPTKGSIVAPPTRLTFFNGSPRGRKGNTPLMLGQLAQGFGRTVETHHLVRMKETEKMVHAFAEAECVILGFPLYTDAMPGVVKHFIEALEPVAAPGGNPPLGFLVQSGFPEGLHSRYVERYLEKLAARLGSPYLGTIVKGNGEGIRVMPPEATNSIFSDLQRLGAGLAKEGRLDPEILQRLALPERFPAYLRPVFQVFLQLPMAHSYFDGMLRKNGVYEKRFARPFIG